MKPIITVDFDGALLRHRPFERAHINWFDLFARLLKDNSIKEAGYRENYFDKVHEVMERYLGKGVSSEARVEFARELFAMVTVAEVQQNDLVAEFADYLRSLKDRYTLALITSAPASSVEPILQKVGCSGLFDVVYKSPVAKHPNKEQLFKEFIEKHGKPAFYIGNGDKDILFCKKLGITTISVSWVSKGEIKGDYDISKVKELEKILK
jgi:phosphoglycolate phosphatase-like HAD superfamily hydrolase